MILDLIVLVLRASLPLVPLIVQIIQLTLSVSHVFESSSPCQMTVHEGKRGVLKAKSHHNGALFARIISHGRGHVRHGDVENASLNLSFGDQEQEKAMLIDLADDGVGGLACMRVKDSHHVVLHELDSFFIFAAHTEAFDWDYMLKADDKDVRCILDIIDTR